MTNICATALLAFVFLVIPNTRAAATSATVSPNNKNVYCGKYTISTASTYNTAQSQALNWSPLNFTATYPTSIQGQSSYYVALGLVDLNMMASLSRTNFSILVSYNSSALVFQVYSFMANFIQRMSLRYLILSGSYYTAVNMYIGDYQWQVNANLNSTVFFLGNASLTAPLNTTGTMYAVSLITGLQVISFNNTLNLFLAASVSSSTVVNFILQSTSASSCNIANIRICLIIFNGGYYNQTSFAVFYAGNVTGASGQFALNYSNSNNCSSVTLFGVNGLAVQSDTFVDFTVDVGSSSNSISISSANSASAIKNFSVMYVTFLTNYCSSTSPYFYSASNVCYDVCPVRTYADSSNISCISCSYDCYTCNSSGSCLSCNATTDFRTLSTSRCVPMPGYFQNLTTVCPSCGTNCLQCTSATNCTYCVTGNYLSNGSNGLCNSCPSICLTCTSAKQCQSCTTGYTLNANYCYLTCTSTQYFNVSSLNCQSCPTGCLTCTSSTQCQSCTTGYNMNSSTNLCSINCSSSQYLNVSSSSCQPCPNSCITCVSSTSCQSCSASAYLSGGLCNNCTKNCKSCLSSSYCYACQTSFYLAPDRLCYDVCPARTYLDSLLSCLSCPIDCYYCNSAGNCTNCSSSDFRTLNTTTYRCNPMKGYFDNQTSVCVACLSACSTCLDLTKCTSCAPNYFLSGGGCQNCPSSCQLCLSSSYCVSCRTGYYLNASNLCSTTCAAGYYSENSTSTCNPCSSLCQTCSAFLTCTACSSGTFLVNQTCVNCPSTCAACISLTVCQTCAAGYNRNSNGSCIAQCSPGLYQSSVSECSPCSNLCLTCSNYSACTSCYPGYYSANNSCYTCDSFQVLKPDLTCATSCPVRYYVDPNFRTCQPCPYDCFTCDITGKCLSCNEATDFRVFNNQTSRCLPKMGYFDNSVTISVSCPNNCLACSSISSCSLCNTSYYLNSGTCSACPAKCSSCLSLLYCTGCLSGSYLRIDNLCYDSCPERSYLQNIICVNCPYSCLSCSSSGKCLSCSSSDFRSFSNGLCVPNDGYYDNQVSVCSKCPDGCATCSSFQSCSTCKASYYFNTFQCLACPSNCQQCMNANSCNTCNSDYTLNSGQCRVSAASSDSTVGLPIGILMGAAIGGTISLIIFCIYKKCRRTEPKPILIKAEQGMQSTIQMRGQELSAQSSENEWHDRARQISSQQDCSICLMQQAFFKSNCGHSFHLLCIMEWLKKRSNCPNCRELMTREKHKIYCRKCHGRYKVIKLDKLKEMDSTKKQEIETICEECKLVPL